jgi:hypothetical protein
LLLDHAGRFLREHKIISDPDPKTEFEASEREFLVELMVEHSQMQFFGETYSVQDLLNLLGQINTVIEGIRDYRQQQINEKYSEILNKYIELVVDEGGESTPITRV